MKLKAGQTLFKDESVFEPSYLPEDFLYRDSQIKEMKECALPAMKNRKPTNAFVFGKPATGKTTAARLLFSELEKESKNALAVHVNAHIYGTQYRILGEIHKKLFGFVPPETGLPVTALYDKVFTKLEKDGKPLILALDDMNFQEIKQANSILYDLVRVYEIFPKVKVGVWCISVNNELHKLDDKVRSTFITHEIEFLPYKKEEMRDILAARARAGLFPDVIGKELLVKIAAASDDIRHGIELLKKAAALAEDDNSAKITEKHVNGAVKSFLSLPSSSLIDDEKIILDLLKKRGKESGELYDEFRAITSSSYSTFYRLLKNMKKKNAVEIKQIEKEKGRTSMISAKKV